MDTRYDYNLYLYHHHRYWKNKLTANMVLFSNAVINIKRKKYDRAKQELDLMYSEKHKINDLKKIYFLKVIIACYEQNEEEIKDAFERYTGIKDTTVDYPDADTLMNWILDNDIEKMTETTDSKEKTDANNTNCDEFVLEKRYVNGGYDTEIIDFYLINPNTLEVTDEHKTTW